MNWEETIQFIRTQPEYKALVELAYFEEDLPLNIERFRASEEYTETKKLITKYASFDSRTTMLDIGSGNGISSVSFAIDGIQVHSVEPDPSETIGAGAIRKLKEHYKINNLTVYEGFAEDLKFPDKKFDIVYSRQCLHHAADLQKFLLECSRVLKVGGLLITIRDHVIYDQKDKEWFLANHPLQQFYGGENAFTPEEYRTSIKNAGLEIKEELKHFDNVINFFPMKADEKKRKQKEFEDFVESIITRKLGVLSRMTFLRSLAKNYVLSKLNDPFDERKVPGRMYSFIAIKQK